MTVVSDDPPADLPVSPDQMTVDGLYDLLLDSWLQGSVDEFNFEFDSVMGFPEFISQPRDICRKRAPPEMLVIAQSC